MSDKDRLDNIRARMAIEKLREPDTLILTNLPCWDDIAYLLDRIEVLEREVEKWKYSDRESATLDAEAEKRGDG